MLIVFAGLPGAGKSTIARELAGQIGAVYVRIDSIEQAIRASQPPQGPMDDAGYRAGHAVALDNLRLGLTVIADSVNPLELTRAGWREVAQQAGVRALEVEVICPDRAEHRRRVESRLTDVPGLRLPSWREVETRDYEPWTRPHLVIDSARQSVAHCVRIVRAALPRR
jgi:predicted kinase